MSPSLRAMAFGTVAVCATVIAVAFLLPYFVQSPIALAMPGAVLALCVFVVALEGPTRKRIRAFVEGEASARVASWEYSEDAWPDVVRAAPGPTWGLILGLTALTTACVALVAGLGTQDARALLLAAAWAVAFGAGMLAGFSYRDAALLRHPRRRLLMTRSIAMLGDRIYLLNPEPALPEVGANTFLVECMALPRFSTDQDTRFAGSITWICAQLTRNSRRRMVHRFPVPSEHEQDVPRVVAAYTAIAAPNRANPALALPK